MLSWAVDVFVSLGSHKIPPFDGSRNRRNKRECASYPRSHRKSNACLPILCCLPIPHCFSRQKKGQRGHANSLSSCPPWWSTSAAAAAAAAKSLQSCQTLCDPIDGSPPGSTIPGILQARTLEQVAISFSDAWKWKVKVKSLSYMKLLKVIINANTAYISTMYSVNRHFTHTVLNFPTITWGGFYTYHYEEGNWSCYVFRVMQQYKAKDPTQISMGCLFSIDSSHKEFSKKKKNYPRWNQCFKYERHKNFPFGNLYFYPQRRTYMETGLAGEEVGTTPASQRLLWAFTFPWSSFILTPVATTKLSPHLLGLGRQRGWERNTFRLFLSAQGKHNLSPCFSLDNWDRLTYSR